ncbi:MAG: hypothetical protein ACP5OA_03460 [Candidatus Woesearchaeota archaeon]
MSKKIIHLCSRFEKTKCTYANQDGTCSVNECEMLDLIETSPDYDTLMDKETDSIEML